MTNAVKRRSSSRKKKRATKKPSTKGEGSKGEGYLWCVVYIALFVVGWTSLLIKYHYDLHHLFNKTQICLALFLVINTMICLWEIALFIHIPLIKRNSERLLRKTPSGSLGTLFLFQPLSLRAALSLETWSEIWTVYSLVDTSYANSDSFGWSIDTGNGISALVPSIVLAIGMSNHDLMSPKTLGCIGLASYWQMCYGTLLYFFQYVYHKRWKKHGNSWMHIVCLVVMTNVFWIVFPLLGMLTSVRMIQAEDATAAWAWLK